MITAFLSLAVPTGVAFFVLDTGRRGDGRGAERFFLSIGLGFGGASLLFFIWSALFGTLTEGALALELTLLAVSWRIWRWSPVGMDSCARPLPLAVAVLAGMTALFFVCVSFVDPHGAWDAWAIWNMKGRFWFREGLLIHSGLDPTNFSAPHKDYPSLLPGLVAGRWTLYTGIDTPLVPMGVAGAYTAAILGTLFTFLRRVRGNVAATLAILLLMSAPPFLATMVSQYADLPLAFYLLAFFVFMADWSEGGDAYGERGLLLAGLAIGMAAWTKNEGSLMLVASLAMLTVGLYYRKGFARWRSWLPFAAGMALPLVALLSFKVFVAHQTYFTQGQTFAMLVERATSLERYQTIASSLAREMGYYARLSLDSRVVPAPVLLAISLVMVGVGQRVSFHWWRWASVGMLATILGGYTIAYLLTPLDLAWQLSHSLDRLLAHLWPSGLLLAFLFAPKSVRAER